MDFFERRMETINKLIAIIQASQRERDAERREYAALKRKAARKLAAPTRKPAARKRAATKRPARKPPNARP